MEINEVGEIIYILRKRLHITQSCLSKGLCSSSHISRIEAGTRVPDMLLMEALFQRLGKSPDKIEMMLSERDYTLCTIRMEIEMALLKKNYAVAEKKIKYYAQKKEAKNNLHKQYIYKMKAILQKEAYGNIEKSNGYLKAAVKLTLPDFEAKEKKICLLSVREIQLLLMLSQNYIEEREEEAIALMTTMRKYLDKMYTDEEEKVKIFPKVVYLLAKALLKKKQYKEASELCGKAINLLGSSCVIVCLLEILQLQVTCLKELEDEKKLILMINQKTCLESLYRKYDIELLSSEINIWEENTQKEIYLIHELVKKSRKKKKITQEKLTNKIDREQETISRIETGKQAPNKQTLQRLKDGLGIDRTHYMGYISTDEFEIHEKNREIFRFVSFRKFDAAQKCLEEVKGRLKTGKDENYQYVFCTDTILKLHLGEIEVDIALEKLIEALGYTQKEYADKDIFNGVLTRQEVFILNNVAIIYKRMNNYEKAIEILEKVLRVYEKSEVDIKFHSVGILLTMVNLSVYYEESGQLAKAIKLCDVGIRISLECGRGNCIVDFLTEKAYILERMNNGNKKACIKYFKQAFFISKLMKNMVSCNVIEQHLKSNYKVEII